jgi:hypothetical protein
MFTTESAKKSRPIAPTIPAPREKQNSQFTIAANIHRMQQAACAAFFCLDPLARYGSTVTLSPRRSASRPKSDHRRVR